MDPWILDHEWENNREAESTNYHMERLWKKCVALESCNEVFSNFISSEDNVHRREVLASL